MEFKDIKAVYFIGAGGIGMSAIARYFMHKGLVVAPSCMQRPKVLLSCLYPRNTCRA